jgi:hypothetical protein
LGDEGARFVQRGDLIGERRVHRELQKETHAPQKCSINAKIIFARRRTYFPRRAQSSR